MKRLLTVLALALIAAGTYAYWPRAAGPELPPLGAALAQDEEVDTSGVLEMALGAEDAPVTVIEYASPTCPHCASFHNNTYPELKASYIDTGKVRFIFREVYFDRFGLWAAMVARCGSPDPEAADAEAVGAFSKRYFAIMNMIFEQQRDWLQGDSPAGIADNLSKIGRTAGLGKDQVDACLQDADMAKALVAVYQENATEDEVQSTPTFLINGEKHTGDMSFDEFSALVDAEIDG